MFDGGVRAGSQANCHSGAPHLFFFTLDAKNPPKIIWVLQSSNVSEYHSVCLQIDQMAYPCQNQALSRAANREMSSLAASCVSASLTVLDLSTLPTTPRDFAPYLVHTESCRLFPDRFLPAAVDRLLPAVVKNNRGEPEEQAFRDREQWVAMRLLCWDRIRADSIR